MGSAQGSDSVTTMTIDNANRCAVLHFCDYCERYRCNNATASFWLALRL